jgi:SsrA-binding protein
VKILAKNQRASFDYDVKDTFVAGLSLTGAETKSVKSGNVSLTGSYVTVSIRGASLLNCHIGPYQYAPSEKYDPTRSRMLLMKKEELSRLVGKEKGLVLIPLEIFASPRGWLKIKIGLARARKKGDKRSVIRARETDREIRRAEA